MGAIAGSPFEANARWYLALCAILVGDHTAAVPVLEALAKDLPSDKEWRKHRYWLARSRIANGDKRTGEGELRALSAEDGTDWYGLLARQRLGLKPVSGARVAEDAALKRARTDEPSVRPRLLWSLALDDDAIAAVRTQAPDKPTLGDVGLAQSFGDFFWGYRRGPTFLPFPRTKGSALVGGAGWRASYAAPHRPLVDEAARASGITPSFVYAIMRTESGFDPKAVSVAGARGLTQLLPPVARTACARTGRPLSDAERLFEPSVSIALGADVLGMHKAELGSLMLAAAAYNGAPQNVAAWMKRHGSLEVELFVERVPFRETRDYIKKVLATDAIYRALDGAPLALDVPKQIGAPPEKLTVTPYDR
jgi:soluble lytic murein transglycosylase